MSRPDEYWKLKESPFENVCDTRFFFESDDHREALDRMLYITNDTNMSVGLLTGEVGSGKTLTKNVFINSLSRNDFEIIDFENSNFEYPDILHDVVVRMTFRDPRFDIGGDMPEPERGDKYQLTQLLKYKLETLIYSEQRHLILVFDEAQFLRPEVLDEVKTLTNISSETKGYITIFLVGQPELRDLVHKLRQVDQRIFLRFHLNNLDYSNTVKYIRHRLRISGLTTGSIFTSEACEYIFRYTGGVPREINRLCKLALNYGFAQDLEQIDSSTVDVVYSDLREHSR